MNEYLFDSIIGFICGAALFFVFGFMYGVKKGLEITIDDEVVK